jgi:hypothetical protein
MLGRLTEVEERETTACKGCPLFKKMKGQKRLGRKSLRRLPERKKQEANEAHDNHRDDAVALPSILRIGGKCKGYQNQCDCC